MAKKSTSTALTAWDEELARQAEIAAALEANAGGGQFFSIRGGVLSWQDAPLPNNEMAVVILDSIFENVYYEGQYDPDTPQAPTCFAFAKEEDALTPHEIVVKAGQAQSTDGCKGCEHNEWGSADRGRGKACRNTRRLAMLPAGTFARDGKFTMFTEPEHYATTAIGFMKLPVTSVKGYANFVRQVAGALRRPPAGIVTRVSVVADPKTQFKVLFEPMEKVPNELMEAVLARRNEVDPLMDFPYNLEVEETPPRSNKKALAKPTRGRKY